MVVLQVNALYGSKSTGTIIRHIQDCCFDNDIDGYVAFSYADRPMSQIRNGYQIGNRLTKKWHAILSRIAGKQAYYNRITTWKFLRYLDRVKPDIVHLHNLHNNYIHLNLLLRYLAKNNITTIITMHDCWYFTGGCFHYDDVGCKKWQYRCGRCPKKCMDTPAYLWDASADILRDRDQYLNAIPKLIIVGCSEWVVNECRKSVLGDKEIYCIHNGFDLNVFHPVVSELRAELGVEDKYVLLCPASKWLSAKNKETYDFFVSHLEDNMVLVLFGCTYFHECMPSNVKQIGFISDANEMAKLYSMADVFVNCSREDTFSSLNIEAQACGTPVVTYEATGNRETVDGVCGYAVETGNYVELLAAVKCMKNIGKQNLSQLCVERVQVEFEKDEAYIKYINLYKQAYLKDTRKL